MERYPMENIPGLNQMQLQQMKMFLKGYEEMKDQISFEMMGQVNDSMRQMILLFIKQLREELGEEEPLNDEQPQGLDQEMTIDQIDARLRLHGLSEEEINQLLDARAKLQQRGL